MKYIVYFEVNVPLLRENPENFRKINRELLPKLVDTPEFPKPVSKCYHFPGKSHGFRIYEAENQEQIANYCNLYGPYVDYRWEPIVECEVTYAAADNYMEYW